VTNMTAQLSERITLDASICHGEPCIRGLRYPVENILEWLSAGMSVEEILAITRTWKEKILWRRWRSPPILSR